MCESSNTDMCTYRSDVNCTIVVCTEIFCKCIYRLKAEAEKLNVEYYALKKEYESIKNVALFLKLPHCSSSLFVFHFLKI